MRTSSSGVGRVGGVGRGGACLVLLVAAALVGCGPSPAMRPAKAPGIPENAVRVVRADEVKGTCECDDDDDVAVAEQPAKPVQYVKMHEWSPAPQVAEFEATAASRPVAIGTSDTKLSLHQPIGETTVRAWRGRAYVRR